MPYPIPAALAALTLVLALSPIAASAQGSAAQAAAAEAKSSPIITKDPNPQLRVPISLSAQDASLSDVLRVLAERSSMNFVAGDNVQKAKITIILNKTPVSEAIDLIVRAAGLSYEIIGNSVLIGESGKLKDEVGQSGYVIALHYADAAEVAQMLGDLSKTVKVDRGGNRLIAYASPRVINEIERIVRSIDHPHTQVMLETRLIEVTVDENNRYGIDWGALSPVSTNVSFPASSLREGLLFKNGARGPVNLNLVLDMLIQNGDARVLMNSKLTTTNNREATLHIGEKIPYVIQSYNSAAVAGGGANQQVQHEEVGVKVRMEPHVNEDAEITLNLEPEVSSITGFKGPNADLPLVKVRKTKTTVRVTDGQTIFLAGLLSEEETEELRKLPVLGQIPVLGQLFTRTLRIKRKTNLIIEIKPKIIRHSSDLIFNGAPRQETTPAQGK
ncbi:MAG TPA: secretin N-terminal domain-containing protein [Fibrobacteria bacterium]|nr:secretin N-terminal domain-containing protein [Fibrobacteria bacterium]